MVGYSLLEIRGWVLRHLIDSNLKQFCQLIMILEELVK